MSKVAFLGMGVMGYPMAGHIASAGHEGTVFNRTAAKAEAWAPTFSKLDFSSTSHHQNWSRNILRSPSLTLGSLASTISRSLEPHLS